MVREYYKLEMSQQALQNPNLGFLEEEKCDYWPVEKCSVTPTEVKKYTPETNCEKVPREMCAPAGCGLVEVISKQPFYFILLDLSHP